VTVAAILSADIATALTTPGPIGATPNTGNFTSLTATSVTSTGQILATLTTEQMRLRYDASNYATWTVSSAGDLTIATTSGAAFISSRLGIAGATLTSVTTLLQTSGVSQTVTGAATVHTLHRMSPTLVVQTSNQTGIVSGSGLGLTIDQGGQSVTQARGMASTLTVSGATGTVTQGNGFDSAVNNSGAGTLALGVGYRISAPTNTGGGTYTSFVGVGAPSITTPTNVTYILLGTLTAPSGSWSIYSATTNDSSIAGKTKMGANTAPATTLDTLTSDSATNTVTNVVTIGHDSSGTPAASYGTGVAIQGKSSTTAGQSMGRVYWQWSTATHATRQAYGYFTAQDYNGERIGITVGSDGTQALLSFYNVTPVARPTAYTQTYSTTTRTVNPASTSAFTGIDNAQAGTPYAKLTDVNQLRLDMLMSIQIENAIIDDQQAFGLFQ
jgi:hypothetical protein